MTTETTHHHDHHEEETRSKIVFGFWSYILSDCILFTTLIISYVVLRNNTFGGIGIHEIAKLPFLLVQSLILLTGSLSFGFAFKCSQNKGVAGTAFWLIVTLVLGLIFAGMQFHEFSYLMSHGYTWKNSAFLSAFFTLLGTFWIHVLVAMLWMVVLLVQMATQKLTAQMQRRMSCLGMFWHFLNIMWVFIFTIVFLMGVI